MKSFNSIFPRGYIYLAMLLLQLLAWAPNVQAWYQNPYPVNETNYKSRQYSGPVSGMGTQAINYRLFVPPSYSPTGNHPVVIFLHGNGEGEDADPIVGQPMVYNSRQMGDLGQYIFLSDQTNFPCFFVLASRGKSMNVYPVGLEDGRSVLMPGLVQDLKNTYPGIDLNRVIITGLSGGGGDALLCAIQSPSTYAALIQVCATEPTNKANSIALGDMASWHFHAYNDPVTVWGTLDHVRDRRAQGKRPILTRYMSGGHEIWYAAYSTPPLLPWVIAQRKGLPVQNSPATVTIQSPTMAGSFSSPTPTIQLSGTTTQLGGVSNPGLTQVEWSIGDFNHGPNAATGLAPWSTPTINLNGAGSNTLLEVVAVGTSWHAGNGGNTYYSATLNATYNPSGDNIKPTVTVTTPSGSTVTTNSVNLVGTANDNVGLQSVTCKNTTNGNALTTVLISGTSANWNASVPLVPGLNNIEVTSKDTANLVSSPVVTRTVTYNAGGGTEFLKVDLGNSPTAPTGFSKQSSSSAVHSTTMGGSVQVDIVGSQGFWTGGNQGDSGAYTYAKLYNDFVYNNTSGEAITFTLSGTGILPNTSYAVRVFTFDDDNSGTTNYVPVTPTTGTTASISWTGTPLPGSNNDPNYSKVLTLTSSSTGQLIFRANASPGWLTRVNGFVVSTTGAPPPPTAFLQVDFGFAATEEGFSKQNATSALHNGNVTVAITGSTGFWTGSSLSDSTTLTYAQLYNDFVYTNTGLNMIFTLSGPGILPSTAYQVIVYGYDSANTVTMDCAPVTPTTGTGGQLAWLSNTPPGSNDSYSVTLSLVSGSNGQLSFMVDPSGTPGTHGRVSGIRVIKP